MSLQVGQVFAGYTIRRVLGAGGMGQVYLALHPRLPREDALKVLPAEFTDNPEFRGRFLREADVASGLSHPHIVGIHDRGEEDGHLWISMDYVAGTDAGRLLLEHFPGGMPLDQVVPIIGSVASALDYAHSRGLLHRDVKPANILLSDPDGQARRTFLADFGIARRTDDSAGLTATNMTVGTVLYAAPEQLKGESIDGRADQYALACTAFHLLTGSPPYGDTNPAVVISQHIYAPPPSIGASRPDLAALNTVFATAMAKERSDRFRSCQEFADQLGQHSGPGFAPAGAIPFPDTEPPFDVTVPALPRQPAPSAWQRMRQRPRVLVAALVGIVLLVVGGVFAGLKLNQSDKPVAHAPSGAPTTTTAPPNAGPFTGVYTARFSQASKIDGTPATGTTAVTDTYAVRSACGSTGCVATAARLSGDFNLASSTVFDQVDGRWFAISLGSEKCRDNAAEVWQVMSLQPAPDGTLTGEFRGEAANSCAEKRTVTFARTGDVDINSLPDPAGLPPRVVSPAEALHGRYRIKRDYGRYGKQQEDESVTTDCLRTGDRCMSYFYTPISDQPMVFQGGKWIFSVAYTQTSQGCTNVYFSSTVEYPMPQPPQNPITQLTGHGHLTQTGACAADTDVTEILTRIGD
jgi:hypothetical protein